MVEALAGRERKYSNRVEGRNGAVKTIAGNLWRIGAFALVTVAVPNLLPQTASPANFRSPSAETALVPGNFVDTTAASGAKFMGVASHTSKKYLIETMG